MKIQGGRTQCKESPDSHRPQRIRCQNQLNSLLQPPEAEQLPPDASVPTAPYGLTPESSLMRITVGV